MQNKAKTCKLFFGYCFPVMHGTLESQVIEKKLSKYDIKFAKIFISKRHSECLTLIDRTNHNFQRKKQFLRKSGEIAIAS